MSPLIAVGAGGFLGAVGRYGLTAWFVRGFGWAPLAGTLGANLLGCLTIGGLMAFGETHWSSNPTAQLFLRTGLLGGLTTFSTFGYETVVLARDGAWGWALANVGANVLLGLSAVAVGFVATRGAMA